MSYNGSGTFVINSTGQPVVTGTVISSTAFNALTADLATGLSTALTKDGQTTPTANLPMGTFKFTGLSAGSAATDSANIAQVQNSFGSFLTVSGTDTITATVSPALTAYASGQMFAFVAANTNTGAVTINISSLGAKSITKNGTTALAAGDITANYLFVIVYDGTQFQVVGVSATTFTDLTISGVLTLSGAGVQLNSSGTGAWKLPVGTTAQRPTGASGLIRQNSTTGNPEWYDATTSQWLQFSQPAGYAVNYLVVAGGGGGGGYNNGAGGGAGGLLTTSTTLSTGSVYTITVGAGGAGGSAASGNAANGSASSISSIATSTGGGGGGGFDGSSGGTAGSSGGSGGGGGAGSASAGGAGTSGQGFAGGNGTGTGTAAGGGGGGASAVGNNASSGVGGNGGAGVSNSISGAAVNYAGGGGGSTGSGTVGTGGLGGGGAGAISSTGTAGTANTGGGGGGKYTGSGTFGGAGGSGIVIISYLGSQRGTGGTVTSSGGYTIHTFTSSGTYNA
mgnify:CR=1 FL=1|jgi:hypothetical protein